MSTEKITSLPTIVSIKIAFPVEYIQEAYDKRKAIFDILSNIPNAKLEFSVMSLPGGVTLPTKDDPQCLKD